MEDLLCIQSQCRSGRSDIETSYWESSGWNKYQTRRE